MSEETVSARHSWSIEEINIPKRSSEHVKLGSVAKQSFWVCRNCGATGGPAFVPDKISDIVVPTADPYLAGTPLVNISDDCQRAKSQIDEFIAMYPVWKEYADKIRQVTTEHRAG